MARVRTEIEHDSQHCLLEKISAAATQHSHNERYAQGKSVRHTCPRNSNRDSRTAIGCAFRELTAILCIAALLPGNAMAVQTQQPATPIQPSATSTEQPTVKLPPEQLDSLVAPIALYPDPMLTQTLVASTYPLELIQLKQWLDKHKDLKDKALADAVQKQDWDPSIQAMAALPDVVKQLADNIKWTADLGNAFLAQQSDVMDAVQRMRKKATDAGNLKSSEQQKVETKVVESKQVIVIEQANPQVVYVPSYNPTVVYGPPVYPYPPIAYPPPGYYAAGMAISFGIGIAMGAAWGGGWGYGAGWGGNNVYVNHNNFNNFNGGNNITGGNNIGNGNRGNGNLGNGNRPSNQPARGGNNNWQHNPQHRGGAPYGDRNTASKFGGTSRGDSISNRQASARQNQNPRAGQQPAGGLSDRGGGPSAGTRDMNRGGGGADRVGNRQVSQGPSATNRSAFGGASAGMSGGGARASSSRGSSSMGGFGGGGGGGRSGGGRRR
jgi:hypothetical protein